MRRLMWCLGALLCLMPAMAAAVEYSIDSASYLRFQQYDAPGFDRKFQVPATQYLTIDAGKLGVDGLSLHFYGWGSATMGSVLPDDDRYNGNLTYFYLQYRLPRYNAQVKAGRFFVFEGLANEQVDGVSFRTDLPFGFTLSAFGGAPSKLDYAGGNKGDTIAGGRVSGRVAGFMELGVSTLYEGGIRTTVTNGTLESGAEGYVPPGSLRSYRQLVGGDIWLSPVRMVELNGHTTYNLATSGIAENSYLLTVTPLQALSLTGDYTEQNPSDYFSGTNMPSLFKQSGNDKFRRYGGTVTATPFKNLELSFDYRHYTRNQKWLKGYEGGVYKDYGNSDRYGVDVRMNFVENRARTGFAIHRVDGPSSTLSYNELRGYALYDAHTYVASFDAIGQFYDAAVNTTSSAYELLCSAGYRFTPHLLLSGDISYGQNPDYRDEVKGLIKLVYNFTSEGKGAHK